MAKNVLHEKSQEQSLQPTPDEAIRGLQGTILKWRRDPVSFVKEAIGVNPTVKDGLNITTQQLDGLIELGKLVNAKIKVANKQPVSDEELEYSKKRGISIMSGQGTGKDAWAAWAIKWFLTCFPNPKIPCTAPVGDQLKNILWSEISKWLNHRDRNGNFACKIRDFFEVHNDKVFLKEKHGKEWFAVARTANPNQGDDEQSETLAGFHEDYMMIVVDEASGVPEPVFRPLEGSLTGKCNIIVLLFNPTRRDGYALDSQFSKGSDQWIRLHWDSEKSELVSRQHIENVEKKYGRDSDFFRIRIKGLPPASNTNALIPWDWVYDAIGRDIRTDDSDPIILGVDCAGHGDDKAIIIARQGGFVLDIHEYRNQNTTELAGWVLMHMNEYEPEAVCIDSIGLGAGVYDQVQNIQKNSYTVFPVNVAQSPRNSNKYHRLRDELWGTLRDKFEKGLISIPDDDELLGELATPRCTTDGRGRIKVEGKREMRKRGRKSPNKADALCLTYYMDDNVLRIPKRYSRPQEELFARHEDSFMTV